MRHAALVAGIVFFAGLVQAQTFGVITGEVTDATGAVAPNVTVTATNTGTNASRATKTICAGPRPYRAPIPSLKSAR